MARTIQQIYGDTGISQDATKDIFAETEEKSKESLERSLSALRSVDEEAQSAKGFQGNTFLDASRMQQEEGIISSLEMQLAGTRLQEDIKQQDFNRGIVGATYQYDLGQDMADSNLSRTKSLNQSQFELGEKAADSGLTRQQELIETQTKNQTQLMKEQSDLEIARMKESSTIQSDYAKLSTSLQTGLNTQMQQLQALTANQQFAKTKELTGINFENSMDALMKQYNLGELSANSTLQRSIQQLDAQTDNQLNLIDTQWRNGELSANAALARQKEVIGYQFDQQAKLATQELKDRYTFLTGKNLDDNPKGELAIRQQNSLALLQEQLAIEKQTALAQVDLQSKWTVAAETIKNVPELIPLFQSPTTSLTAGATIAAIFAAMSAID